jgi:probable rRNA maturation factor
MARMNREFLGHRGATDVITFELAATMGATVGDIYIAPDVARDNARERGIGVREELVRLVVHGTLHVLGYTHAEDESRMSGDMWRRQERIVAAIV